MKAQPLAGSVRGRSTRLRPAAHAHAPRHRIRCRASAAREPAELETAPAAPPPREPDTALDRKGDGKSAEEPSDPRDQRPFIVKMIMSVATGVWSSLGRLVASIPAATAFGKLMVPLLAVACWSALRGSHGAATPPPQELMYSQFVQLTRGGVVKTALIDEGTSTLHFSVDQRKLEALSKPKLRWYQRSGVQASTSTAAPAKADKGPALRQFSTRVIAKDTSFVQEMLQQNIAFGVKRQTLGGVVSKFLTGLFSIWLPLLPFLFIMKRLVDSSAGKGKKRESSNEPPSTTFNDVAGVDIVKQELQEAIACLRDPGRFERFNAKMPSGVLLYGPPGTGKTLLAKAVAGEAGVPFFAVSASEFVEMFVGRGAARIRELFASARKASPAVIFIDELDAVGAKRGVGINDERDQTLNQLLTELDGFDERPSVLLLAATNRPEILDNALLRPGRISRRIQVPLPDEAGRCDILRVHMRRVPMQDDEYKELCCQHLAAESQGFSGAELFNVVNEAALLAARREGEHVMLRDFLAGIQRTRDGVNAKSRRLDNAAKRLSKLLFDRQGKPARAATLV